MPRYLSAAWFAAAGTDPSAVAAAPDLVLEQVVHDAPDGTVTYRVEVCGSDARIVWPVPPGAAAPDLRVTTDWETAVGVARGDMSTQRALMQGRLRFSGQADRLAPLTAALMGVDPVPPELRGTTTFDAT